MRSHCHCFCLHIFRLKTLSTCLLFWVKQHRGRIHSHLTPVRPLKALRFTPIEFLDREKGEINMILLYPPHTNVKSIKHNPKASRPPLNVHLLPLSIRLSAPSKETRPNHNIVKALLVFWFKSLFTLFAEYSSAVTAFRQTASPERGLPQPDLSC